MATKKEIAENNIIKEIEKTGLPTEIKATNFLIDANWMVFNQEPYMDFEKNIMRTIDMQASKRIGTSLREEKKSDIDCNLYIECKKSVKDTWVFYTNGKKAEKPLSYGMYLIQRGAFRGETILARIPEDFGDKHFSFALSHQVIGGGKDDFFEACMQLLKMLEYVEEGQGKFEPNDNEVFLPLRIFDGGIFACYYENQALCAHKTEYVRYLLRGLPNQVMPALIDIVTLDYFPSYLKLLEEQLPKCNKIHASS
jgi:hypothetical protein